MKHGSSIVTHGWLRPGRSQLQPCSRARLACLGTHEWATFDFGLPPRIHPEPVQDLSSGGDN